ncbi:TetR/AcrR family transcriptional regulator [Paraburkholderia susongensis]|uniref:Transcriptional regulator, TetR family n=1 Tax=Paraburkholderia susongensis TaxID=1515439 RepID=A0A1X7JCZ2_9BURK|nr:TetR/AcrR family transcriptional regulator [Paraburkholderia susongensis]SMG25767.1 transcriptional regulator, TetR family [Paraburkholderia susongensis]
MGIVERKNRQRQALRERILDAARRIVMREGFAALSMRKIADAIEYSPATLYLHFESRDEIARALCAEGYAQLLETFVPFVQIADPAERLRALGRAYVAFGVAHPETYRLIFMEDPSYTGAALGGAAGARREGAGKVGAARVASELAQSGMAQASVAQVATQAAAQAATQAATQAAEPGNPEPTGNANDEVAGATPEATGQAAPSAVPDEDADDAAFRIMIDALDELRAAGRLPASLASIDSAVWAEAFWASLHGIVALNLTCPVFPGAPLDTVVGVTLDAWLGTPQAG